MTFHIEPTWTLQPVEGWHVRIDDIDAYVTLDHHHRPIGIELIHPERLTDPIARKLTSARVINAIKTRETPHR